jgi:hypothetical protein
MFELVYGIFAIRGNTGGRLKGNERKREREEADQGTGG